MRRIVTTFRPYGQTAIFFCEDPFVTKGDYVIVETAHGIDITQVIDILKELPNEVHPSTISTIIRKATQNDLETLDKNKKFSQSAFNFCKSRIYEHQLPMKLIDVEIVFDHNKFIFYFTAPSRIDFRELVKDLVREYHAKIELRQIGERNEAQMIGAIGSCGMVCCCRRFMHEFVPVTIKMAKEQNLFLNPSKISGCCGRLLCCLSYEQETYSSFNKSTPRIGKQYQTDHGIVKIVRSNMFNSSITFLNESNEEIELTLAEWNTLNPQYVETQKEKQKKSYKQSTNNDTSTLLKELCNTKTPEEISNSPLEPTPNELLAITDK